MFKKIWALGMKYYDILAYLFFGVCSTVVNIVVYYVCAHPLAMETTPAVSVAWAVSVVFAYVTNKLFVFRSKTAGLAALAREAVSFAAARVATGLMDIVTMYVCVDRLGVNDLLVKVASNVLVVILNYVFSKLFIFKKSKGDAAAGEEAGRTGSDI